MTPKQIFFAIVAGVVCIVGVNALFIVKETEQAMVLTLGKIDRIIAKPGLHIKTPFVQNVVFYDKRLLSSDLQPEEIVTKDKKRAVVDSFTRWRIVDAEKFYQAVRSEAVAQTRLNTIVGSNLRQMLALWNLQDIVSGERSAIMKETLAASRVQAAPLGIMIEDVRVKRVELPEANSLAVYRRMQAEREKEAKEIRAQGAEASQRIRADAERQRTVIVAEAQRDGEKLKGEGDAVASKLYADAYTKDPQFFDLLRTLEAYETSINEGTLMVVDPSVNFLRKFKSGAN